MSYRSPGLYITGLLGSVVWLFDGFTLWVALQDESGRVAGRGTPRRLPTAEERQRKSAKNRRAYLKRQARKEAA